MERCEDANNDIAVAVTSWHCYSEESLSARCVSCKSPAFGCQVTRPACHFRTSHLHVEENTETTLRGRFVCSLLASTWLCFTAPCVCACCGRLDPSHPRREGAATRQPETESSLNLRQTGNPCSPKRWSFEQFEVAAQIPFCIVAASMATTWCEVTSAWSPSCCQVSKLRRAET